MHISWQGKECIFSYRETRWQANIDLVKAVTTFQCRVSGLISQAKLEILYFLSTITISKCSAQNPSYQTQCQATFGNSVRTTGQQATVTREEYLSLGSSKETVPSFLLDMQKTVNRCDGNEFGGELMERNLIYFHVTYCYLSVSFLCNTIFDQMPGQ